MYLITVTDPTAPPPSTDHILINVITGFFFRNLFTGESPPSVPSFQFLGNKDYFVKSREKVVICYNCRILEERQLRTRISQWCLRGGCRCIMLPSLGIQELEKVLCATF